MSITAVLLDRLHLLDSVSADLEASGVNVVPASCVVSALDLARRAAADIILCVDMQLPDLQAADLLNLRSKDQLLSSIPCAIFCTSEERKMACYKKGCSDFILLPADVPELLFRIYSLLARSDTVQGSFDVFSMPAVVQLVSSLQQTGCLIVRTIGGGGLLYFAAGQAVAATAGRLTGENAFFHLLRCSLAGGRFVFCSGLDKEVQTTICKPTEHLLLEAANRVDESGV